MKLAASTLLLGAATASFAPVQEILNSDAIKQSQKILSKPFHDISESLKSVPEHVREAWTEVSMMFPEALEQATTQTKPKAHRRKPDSEWDHVLKGADVQSVWVENAQGVKERELDGKLENYNLRAKKVDPSKLGVDPTVKQYSGYLDDEEEDKHLFYCKRPLASSPKLTDD
jgi:cathepsin A (carboxypeptidase C)